MNSDEFVQSLTILTAIISPTLAAFAVQPQQEQIQQIESDRAQQLISLDFPAPIRRGATSTAGGGRRGNEPCTEIEPDEQIPLVALIPRDCLVTTVAPNPTMFWYIPETRAKSAQFKVWDKQGNDLYYQEFNLPGAKSLIWHSMPALYLEPNQEYFWELTLICDSQENCSEEYVDGKLKRNASNTQLLSPELSQRLGKLIQKQEENTREIEWLERLQRDNPNEPREMFSEPLNLLQQKEKAIWFEQAKLYAEYGLWNETISILAQLREEMPNQWEQLLKSVGIENEEIITAPFVSTNVTLGQIQ